MQPVAFAFLNMFYKVFRFRPEMHKKIRSASKNAKPYYNDIISTKYLRKTQPKITPFFYLPFTQSRYFVACSGIAYRFFIVHRSIDYPHKAHRKRRQKADSG